VFHAPDLAGFGFNPGRANALLDEAGFARGADGVRFKLRLLPAPFFNETRQFGDYLRQALAVVGIDASIVANDTPAHLKAVRVLAVLAATPKAVSQVWPKAASWCPLMW
jgi:peptide/nickel transport system substrate-binding protein